MLEDGGCMPDIHMPQDGGLMPEDGGSMPDFACQAAYIESCSPSGSYTVFATSLITCSVQLLQYHKEAIELSYADNLKWHIELRLKNADFQNTKLNLPHMGWNNISLKKNHHIFSNIKDKSFFYFVHSYFVDPINESEILSTTNYGCTFTSGVSRDNFVALQFHPEKSSSDGLKVLKNFITWDISWKYCQLLIWRMESA